ncbi:MAG: HEAT repeat domain-containing protein [Planctomycetaceae bacterium]|nr:HEAT repeat domain-containing protein [Planctomycetaceae bacterium]
MSHSTIEELIHRLGQICDARTVSGLPLSEWIQNPLPLSPWETWTLLGLVRHRERQQFVADVVTDCLEGDLAEIARRGYLGHPPIPGSGVVPSLIEWEYYLHGIGCCLTHRVTGEAIDVDFADDSAEWFDTNFYRDYLASLKQPVFVESRLIELHPTLDPIRLSIDWLCEQGFLRRHAERHFVRLGVPYERLNMVLSQLESASSDNSINVAVAYACNDWLRLAQLDDISEKKLINEQFELCRKSHNHKLKKRIEEDPESPLAVRALYDLSSPDLSNVMEQILKCPETLATLESIKIIHELDDPKWCPQLKELMERVTQEPFLGSHIWLKSAEFILKHDYPADIKQQIRENDSIFLGELAVLALRYFPDIAIETFQRALRSDVPANRVHAAAALAIIDQPWSRNELLKVLEESQDQNRTSECRSALAMTHDQACHEAVIEWEQKNPHEPELGEYLSMEDDYLRRCDGYIRWEMHDLHDKVLPLRNIIPGK